MPLEGGGAFLRGVAAWLPPTTTPADVVALVSGAAMAAIDETAAAAAAALHGTAPFDAAAADDAVPAATIEQLLEQGQGLRAPHGEPEQLQPVTARHFMLAAKRMGLLRVN
jgi:hypothetical protein